MENKERFIKAIARYQNYDSHLSTKRTLLEKAFGQDTQIFDFDGLDEILDTIVDMATLMFPNLSEKEVRENIEWYVYEAINIEEPVVEDGKGNKYKITNSLDLFNMLKAFNDEETGD